MILKVGVGIAKNISEIEVLIITEIIFFKFGCSNVYKIFIIHGRTIYKTFILDTQGRI